MERVMGWDIPSRGSDNSSEALERCRRPICRIVQAEGAEHLNVKHGLTSASAILGMPYERVRAYWHNAVRRPTADEFLRIQRAFREWKAARCAFLEAEIERLRNEDNDLGEQ